MDICNEYAKKFDDAYFSNDFSTTINLIEECEKYITSNESKYKIAPLYYSVATSYSDLQKTSKEYDNDIVTEKILYYYRMAIKLINSKELNDDSYKIYVDNFKLQLLTNYGVTLNKCDRKLASISLYRNALSIDPLFPMASGNLGLALMRYSFLIHDTGHKNYLNHFAYSYLNTALDKSKYPIDEEAINYFKNAKERFHKDYINGFLEKELIIDNYSLGDDLEKEYRTWCLKEHLFLNPLNDLPLEHCCFAADTLQLPPIVTSINNNEIPIYFGLFNQIKQDYIYSRYLLYCYQKGVGQHFADKETFLVNLYDYPQYSIRVESGKTSFKTLYSLLDKVSYLANHYWNLGIKQKDVNFKSIWKNESGYGKNKYQHKSLDYQKNEAINAVRWIYKDFNDTFGNSDNPYIKELKELRNALEHRYVKVHSSIFNDIEKPYYDKDGTYHTSERLLESSLFSIIRTIRELIIETVMAIHIEEENNKSKNVKTVEMHLYDYLDEWKI